MLEKEEIIKELQYYAKQNGGNTPSAKNFHENTRVNIYQRMKYWPNYNALVREAGLKPNDFDKTKYNREQLCEIFIGVIREIRKWPTRGILDVKHFNDPNFPASVTFYKQLGLTSNLAQTILGFIENKQGHNDVIEICNSVIEEYGNQDTDPEDNDLISGFVYLGKQHGAYKIGKTKDINRRREDITLQGSEPFELIHEIKTDDMNGVEKYWHNRFRSKLKRGEWYRLNISDVKAFKRWKKIV